ncbi:MAG: hypothetical protein R2760_02730 [Chitinophagales bacterium]
MKSSPLAGVSTANTLNPNYAIDILLQSKTPAKYNASLTFAHLP